MSTVDFHWKRSAGTLLLVLLVAGCIVRGIVPALSRVDSDFPSYFAAAKITADGGSTERLYDIPWFQEQMRHYGLRKPEAGKFAPFPPPTALLYVPLVRLEPLTALRVMTGVSVLGLLGSIVLLTRLFSWSLMESAVFVLLSGYAVYGSLRLGQPYILVSASCILGYYARLKGANVLAGLCLGVFVPIKFFPVILLVYFAVRREWRVVLGGAAAALAVIALSVAILGWKVHETYLSGVLGSHLVGNMQMQDPFTASYQSFDSLFRRLFVYDSTVNPQPWLDLPRLQVVGVLITKVAIFAVALASLFKLAHGNTADPAGPSVGILGILTLLLAPATASYHYVLLWLPVGLLANHFRGERAYAYASLMVGLYAFIGFLPYGLAYSFEGHGGLTVLAYPRLFLLLAMFAVCMCYVWSLPNAHAHTD